MPDLLSQGVFELKALVSFLRGVLARDFSLVSVHLVGRLRGLLAVQELQLVVQVWVVLPFPLCQGNPQGRRKAVSLQPIHEASHLFENKALQPVFKQLGAIQLRLGDAAMAVIALGLRPGESVHAAVVKSWSSDAFFLLVESARKHRIVSAVVVACKVAVQVTRRSVLLRADLRGNLECTLR